HCGGAHRDRRCGVRAPRGAQPDCGGRAREPRAAPRGVPRRRSRRAGRARVGARARRFPFGRPGRARAGGPRSRPAPGGPGGRVRRHREHGRGGAAGGEGMNLDRRRVAVAINGFCTFLNLYSPQALLPELSREFGATAAGISTIMTASTLAVALTAPVTGAIADVFGRKRVITAALFAVSVPTVMVVFAADVHAIVVWRVVP